MSEFEPTEKGGKRFSLDQVLNQGYDTGLMAQIDKLVKAKHGFTVSSSMTSTFQGANIMSNTPMLKPNTNSNGYIFTTRPDLNLSGENIKIERRLTPLLTENDNSIMRAIRLILSPRLGVSFKIPGFVSRPDNKLSSPLINNNYPFIAVSDNSVRSMTGWPSDQLGIRSTNAGVLKEVHIMADGPTSYNREYSLNLSAISMRGNPVMYLYYYWILYIGFVYYQVSGLIPWPEYLYNGRMDYTCRHYRLIMDESKTYVTEIAATGYSIPKSIDIGPYFDYAQDEPRPFVTKSTEVEFACVGAIYLDDILIQQFNDTVTAYNPSMSVRDRQNAYIKVDKKYQRIFNNMCYPYINPRTRELEWWVDKRIYAANTDMIRLADTMW